MDANKAAYWIALGVLALGLNSEYRRGNFEPLHRVASRAETALCRISTGAQHTLAMARALTRGDQSPVRNLMASASGPVMTMDRAERLQQRVRERVRSQIQDQIRAQCEAIRAQAEMQRAEIEQRRSEIRLISAGDRIVTFNSRTIVCPKTRTRVVVRVKPEVENISDESDDTL
jgi:hypothetical protein